MRESLSDGVLSIQRYDLAVVDELHRAAVESVNEVYPWMPWCHPAYSREEAESWSSGQIVSWDKGQAYEFVIRTVTGGLVGCGGINCLSEMHPFANLGYWIRSSQTGKGYASRAARLLAEFGLTDAGMQRVEIVAAVGNRASQRVAEKVGATREGILRNRLVLHGQSHDTVMFSLIPADLEKLRSAGN